MDSKLESLLDTVQKQAADISQLSGHVLELVELVQQLKLAVGGIAQRLQTLDRSGAQPILSVPNTLRRVGLDDEEVNTHVMC